MPPRSTFWSRNYARAWRSASDCYASGGGAMPTREMTDSFPLLVQVRERMARDASEASLRTSGGGRATIPTLSPDPNPSSAPAGAPSPVTCEKKWMGRSLSRRIGNSSSAWARWVLGTSPRMTVVGAASDDGTRPFVKISAQPNPVASNGRFPYERSIKPSGRACRGGFDALKNPSMGFQVAALIREDQGRVRAVLLNPRG